MKLISTPRLLWMSDATFPAHHKRAKRTVFFAFLGLFIIHLVFSFAGFYNGDDINFARYAAGLTNNGISLKPATDHFQLRWTPIFTTAAFYKWFGINALSSSLFSSTCLLVSAFLLHRILRREQPVVYVLVMILFFFSRSIIFYSHRLLADAGVCLAVLWMYYAYRSYVLKYAPPVISALSFACAFSFGIITKESLVIAMPLFFILFLRDVFSKRNLAFWMPAIGIAAGLSFVYLLYFKLTTGDFFYRYHLLISRSYINICSFDQMPFIYTLKRITYQLWNAMLLNGDFLVMLPAFAGLFYYKKLTAAGLQKLDVFAFLVLLAAANFMSISPFSYLPLCHDPRHFLFVLPFAALVGGYTLWAFFRDPKRFPLIPLVFLAATVLIFVQGAGSTKYLYLACAILSSTIYLRGLRGLRLLMWLWVPALASIFFLNYLLDFIKPLYPVYRDHKKLMEKNFPAKYSNAVIFSDAFTAEMSEYFLGFETGGLRFLPVDSFRLARNKNMFFLLDASLTSAEGSRFRSFFLHNPAMAGHIIDRHGEMILYRVDRAFVYNIQPRK